MENQPNPHEVSPEEQLARMEQLVSQYGDLRLIPLRELESAGYILIVSPEGGVKTMPRQLYEKRRQLLDTQGFTAYEPPAPSVATVVSELAEEGQEKPTTPAISSKEILTRTHSLFRAIFGGANAEDIDSEQVVQAGRQCVIEFPGAGRILFDFTTRMTHRLEGRTSGTAQDRLYGFLFQDTNIEASPQLSRDQTAIIRNRLQQIYELFTDAQTLDKLFKNEFRHFVVYDADNTDEAAIGVDNTGRPLDGRTIFQLHVSLLSWESLLRHDGFADVADALGRAKTLVQLRAVIAAAHRENKVLRLHRENILRLRASQQIRSPIYNDPTYQARCSELRKKLTVLHRLHNYFDFPYYYAESVRREIAALQTLLEVPVDT